eukprot:430726_1
MAYRFLSIILVVIDIGAEIVQFQSTPITNTCDYTVGVWGCGVLIELVGSSVFTCSSPSVTMLPEGLPLPLSADWNNALVVQPGQICWIENCFFDFWNWGLKLRCKTPKSGEEFEVDNDDAADHSTQITSHTNGKCLDVSVSKFPKVQIFDCHGDHNQQWYIVPHTGEIRSMKTGKCLDVSGGSTANGAQVIVYDCHGGSNQKWTVEQGNVIKGEQSQKCLDIDGPTQLAQIWDCHYGANQKFHIS